MTTTDRNMRPNPKENTMTATTTQPATTTNPHQAATVITMVAIPLIFLGAMWGAGNNPEHAEWSGFAVLAIVALHVMKRIQRNAWNRKHGTGK